MLAGLVEQGLREPSDLARFPRSTTNTDFAARPAVVGGLVCDRGIERIDAMRGLRSTWPITRSTPRSQGQGSLSPTNDRFGRRAFRAARLSFGPELPLGSGYHFVCPKAMRRAERARLPRLLFAEMAETKAKWAATEGALAGA